MIIYRSFTSCSDILSLAKLDKLSEHDFYDDKIDKMNTDTNNKTS